jgi:methionyl-tRNA formyltransferase
MSSLQKSAVVFAYHDVGIRGLSVLLALGVDVRLVVTHVDDPDETIWFSSVAELATLNDIPVITPSDPNAAAVLEQVQRDLLGRQYLLENRLLPVHHPIPVTQLPQ